MTVAKNNKEEIILIYTRPWFYYFYRALGNYFHFFFKKNIIFISDYQCKNSLHLSPTKHEIISTNISGFNISSSKNSSYLDIISRDRLLRTLEIEDAIKILIAYEKKIDLLLETYSVSFCFSATIDQFFVDLLTLKCIQSDIPVIGYHLSVIPGYTLFTLRGEKNKFKEVEFDEVLKNIQILSRSDFRPNYIPNANKVIISGWITFFKNLLRYVYFKLLNLFSIHFNYHYEVNALGNNYYGQLLGLKYLLNTNLNSQISSDIYIPLQLHPECNSEYWHRSNQYVPYEEMIIDLCVQYSPLYKIVLKEHPNMVGVRDVSFYNHIKKSGALLASIHLDNRMLIAQSKFVLTLNSSAGIEALVFDKDVICLSKPYYLTPYHLSKAVLEDGLENFKHKTEKISEVQSTPIYQAIKNTIECSSPVTLPDTNSAFKKKSTDEINTIIQTFTRDVECLLNNYSKPSVAEMYTIKKIGN